VLWLREAATITSKVTDPDVSFVLCISLRQLIEQNKGSWADFLSGAATEFEVKMDAFSDSSYVRLKKLRALAKTGDKAGSWDLRLNLPKEGALIEGGAVVRPFDQSGLPPIRVGNVHNLSLYRAQAAAMGESWSNASPVGKWLAKLYPTSSQGKKADDVLDDLELELELVSHEGM